MKNSLDINIRNFFNPQDTFSTKELAGILNVSTKKAYSICVNLEKDSIICKYGYKTKNGWEEPDFSGLKPNSLHWQVCL